MILALPYMHKHSIWILERSACPFLLYYELFAYCELFSDQDLSQKLVMPYNA